jgi:endonuclease/exonuclease/phosphatase family metal-dependent hydrolase
MKRPVKRILLGASSILLLAVLATSGFFFRHVPRYWLRSEKFDITAAGARTDGGIVVMSYNIRRSDITEPGKHNWYYRANVLVQVIAGNAPDIIGFQEVKELQYNYLKNNLAGYESINEYRDGSRWPESCPLFWRADRYELADGDSYGFFWLSKTPNEMSKADGAGSYRITTWAILKDVDDNEFAVFNTHLDNQSADARALGMEKIFEKISELELDEKNISVMLIGDMNFCCDCGESGGKHDPGAYGVVINAGSPFADAAAAGAGGDATPTSNGFDNGAKHCRIDFIFYHGAAFDVLEYKVDNSRPGGIIPSDHEAVVAVLRRVSD